MMSDTTLCPYCREEIKVGAIRCKHCRVDLAAETVRPPHEAPTAKPAAGARPSPAAQAATLRPTPVSFNEGSRLGDYVLGPLLGHGAMGMVFRAHKDRLAREFAIKILAPHLAADAGLVARFEEEARVQSSLRHPHIVDVVDSIATGGAYAFVMELIEGVPLEQVITERGGALPLPRTLAIMDAVLDAVGYAHDRDVIHRDLKPGNILLARIGGREVVKVADFGLARMLGSQRRTATGATLGTYLYMSPEQCRGDLDVDHRTDLYALGVTLFEMVTGRPPFDAPSDHAILDAHLRRSPPRPSSLSAGVSPQLEAVILRALEKSPDARFQSAAQFRKALAAVPTAIRPPPVPPGAGTVKATATLPAAAQVGATLGRYRLDAELGAGAMGKVFRATDLKFGRPVAIKVLSQEICNVPKVLERLEREATLQAQVTHPNIVAVHDFVKEAGVSAIVMELVNGRNLEALLEKESPLPPVRAVAIAEGILEALGHVHERQVVHRDLKPGNVMLAAGARRETVKVADFGLALRPSEPRMSQVGSVMGTPLYMSPELCNGADIDGRSDLYAVGVMLFEMLTGRMPFEGATIPALMVAHTTQPAPRPSAFIAGVPPALDAVVLRAMAKLPGERFATAGEMIDALEAAVAPSPATGVRIQPPGPGAGGARVPPTSEPPPVVLEMGQPPTRKPRWGLIAAGVGGAAALVVVAVVATGGGGDSGGDRKRSPSTVGLLDGGAGEPRPTGGPDEVAGTSAAPAVRPVDAGTSEPVDAGWARLQDRLMLQNPFVTVGTPPLDILALVVSREAYGWFLASLPDGEVAAMKPLKDWDASTSSAAGAVTWVTFEQASRFCAALGDGARLPTSDEWSRAARDAGKLVRLASASEWTGPADDDGTALIREPRDRGPVPQEEFSLYTQASAGPDAKPASVARANVGFRCVRPR